MTEPTRAATDTHLPTTHSRDLVDFARSWAPYGGPPSDETLVRFGMTRLRFDRAVWESLDAGAVTLDPATLETFTAAYPSPLAHVHRPPAGDPPQAQRLRTNCRQPSRPAARNRTTRRRTFMIGDLVFATAELS